MNSITSICDQLVAKAQSEGIHRLVVGAVISSNSSVLLLKRRASDFMPGIFELPSGRVDEGESLEKALGREVVEETALTIYKINQYLDHFDYLSKSGRKTRQFNFQVTTLENEIQLTEHDDYIWCSRENLDQIPITEHTKNTILHYLQTSNL